MLNCNLSNWQQCCWQRAWATGCVSVPLPTALPSPQELGGPGENTSKFHHTEKAKDPILTTNKANLREHSSFHPDSTQGREMASSGSRELREQPTPRCECIRLWKGAAFWIHSSSLLRWDENFVAKNKYTCSNLVGKPLWSNNNNRGTTDLPHKPK